MATKTVQKKSGVRVDFVDFNRQTALEKGLWSIRMKGVVKWLGEIGYSL